MNFSDTGRKSPFKIYSVWKGDELIGMAEYHYATPIVDKEIRIGCLLYSDFDNFEQEVITVMVYLAYEHLLNEGS